MTRMCASVVLKSILHSKRLYFSVYPSIVINLVLCCAPYIDFNIECT